MKTPSIYFLLIHNYNCQQYQLALTMILNELVSLDPDHTELCYLHKFHGPNDLERSIRMINLVVLPLAQRYFCRRRHSLYSWRINRYGELTASDSRLKHWGRDIMAAIFQATLWNVFSSIQTYEFRLKIHRNLFLRVQLTIVQHCFR